MNETSFKLFLFLIPLLIGMLQAETPAPTPPPHGASGLEGTIFLHNISGGPVIQGVPDAKPLAKTTFVVKQSDRDIASFTTDEQGRFRIALPPGRYLVSKKDWKSRVGFFGPFPVELTAGQMEKVRWNCTTGME